jgi:hypothetical protein
LPFPARPAPTESCGITFPRTGTYYVMVRGATAFSGVTTHRNVQVS